MITDDTYDEIVAGFYKAASGTTAWDEALAPFQRAMSARAIQLLAVDLTQGRITLSHAASDYPVEAELDYHRTYQSIDPGAHLVIGLQPGQWANCWDHFDDRFVAQDRFYQEFLIPYGGRYVSGTKLLQDESVHVLLGVHRGHGSPKLDAVEIATCRRLARHLTDAMVVHRYNVKVHKQGRGGPTERHSERYGERPTERLFGQALSAGEGALWRQDDRAVPVRVAAPDHAARLR
jgi:hypothetical protein